MLLTLGKKPRGEGLVDLLTACHERIRYFVGLARSLDLEAAPLEANVDASARVHRYFVQAFPLHLEDEEEGVFVRLHGRSAAVDQALETMCAEHDEHAALVRELVEHTAAFERAPHESVRVVRRCAEELARVFEPHLRQEEEIIFPAIDQLLSEQERARMVTELRARRHPV